MEKVSLCGLSADGIYNLIKPGGFSHSHALKIANSIYKKRTTDLSMVPGIPKKLKHELESLAIAGVFKPVSSLKSSDNTIKYLFRNCKGLNYETVYIPDKKRNTVCVSTQSGCRMGCPFCVTGSYGFHGDLAAGEIINQIISLPDSQKVTHIVFMGMGEPLDNPDNVLKACEILTAEWGMAVSPRNVTVSTIGIEPEISRFLEKCECNLTLSLFSPFAEERGEVAAVEKKYPAAKILKIMKEHPLKKGRRLSVAYIMICGLNDTGRHLDALKKLLEGSGIRVNLIPFHPPPGDQHLSSPEERMQFFRHE
ncbi:MAG: radical SAM protein, partial [Bacteroidales bacterium]|nr:radical SAM protein [Bacteroidales bacterium]